MGMCKQAADALMSYTVQEVTDEKLRSDYIKHIVKWQQFKYRETILKDAASVRPVSLSAFDSDPYLFNCLNGTLNLHNMSFHEHTSADRLTMIAGVEYCPEARCERWERFIDEVTISDNPLQTSFKRRSATLSRVIRAMNVSLFSTVQPAGMEKAHCPKRLCVLSATMAKQQILKQ